MPKDYKPWPPEDRPPLAKTLPEMVRQANESPVRQAMLERRVAYVEFTFQAVEENNADYRLAMSRAALIAGVEQLHDRGVWRYTVYSPRLPPAPENGQPYVVQPEDL